ncbi:MAG: Ku protein [Deltaproteobacteria bacterium]|nr:Ku protein [Deltaproteobacteria bacterium]
MPARAMSSATLSFGLVAIPVKIYSASAASEAVSFNLLHKKCGSRVKQQYICPTDDGAVVERDDMVKGYEFQKGHYVTFTADELKAIEEEATQAIEITEFVPAATVDPVYFDKAYYLGPEKGGDKPYRLLIAAMQETGRVALAKYAGRGKQYLVMVRVKDGALVMQQLHYADEVRPSSEVPVPTAAVGDTELQLAVQLVSQIAKDEFHPEAYHDDVKERLLGLVQKKIEGRETTIAAPEAPKAQVIDLMEALKASLGQTFKGGAKAGPRAAEPTPATPTPREVTTLKPVPKAAPAEGAPARKPAKRVERLPGAAPLPATGKARSHPR